ncbi:MAG: 1-acyl-sn-glycerol-3-phosphate acyltransferase [Deltaproteobacteria bacterium]|nr:1-acyl-sn-glycerol-3-phosphate acyltransferase [Deltaproteobacteria bacterium]
MISFRALIWLLFSIPFFACLSFAAFILLLITWNPMLVTDILKPVFSKVMLWVLRIRLKVHGKNFLHQIKPAIFIGNHQSMLDLFIFPALLPNKTFGIGKKELLRYPFLGWIVALTGQVTVDRSNHFRAMRSMQKVNDRIKKKGYSVFLCPEGTRSYTAKLLPFKKGAFYLAMQTRLPIVPIVVLNAYQFLPKGTLNLKSGIIEVHVLEPISTTDWKEENLKQYIAEVEQIFEKCLSLRNITPLDPR